jgi:hypothetical protein
MGGQVIRRLRFILNCASFYINLKQLDLCRQHDRCCELTMRFGLIKLIIARA